MEVVSIRTVVNTLNQPAHLALGIQVYLLQEASRIFHSYQHGLIHPYVWREGLADRNKPHAVRPSQLF
jgi:hypothetical protein